MMIKIKNNTVWAGRPKLRFSKCPCQPGKNKAFNKVHLNLGFTKIISVVEMKDYDTEKLDLIALHTHLVPLGFRVTADKGTYKRHRYVLTPGEKENGDYVNTCVFNKEGDLVGNAELGWEYYLLGLTADDKHPGLAFSEKEQAWYVFTDHGFDTFKLYDLFFDPSWKPQFPGEYIDYMLEALGGELSAQQIQTLEEDPELFRQVITMFIPYDRRGDKMIETLAEAKEAAVNFYNHVNGTKTTVNG